MDALQTLCAIEEIGALVARRIRSLHLQDRDD